MSNNKKLNFYKFGENSKYHWLDVGENYNLTSINNGRKINNLECVLIKGVKMIYSTTLESMVYSNLTDKEVNKLARVHNAKLEPMTLNKIKTISLKILNASPKLSAGTCLGWGTFPLKKDDPNYYSGAFIFPDGNIYTVVKCFERVEVYPSEGDHCFMMNDKKLPLIKYKIDREVWAEKITNNKVKIIETKS